MIIYISCFFALAVVLTATAFATDYYVKTDGNNLNDGLSPETAWKSIAYAVSSSPVSAGDTIYVLDGHYSEGSNNIIFQKDSITLTAYNQESPNVIIDGWISDNQNHYVLTIYNHYNITIDKLEIVNGGIGIDVRDSNYIDITDCVVHGAAWMGIEICGATGGSGSHHCTVDNCEIYSCGWNLVLLGGLTDQPGTPTSSVSTYLSVTNCKIHDGINHNLVDLCGDMEYVNIVNNTLWNGVHGSFYTHQTVNGAKYYYVYNNTISDSVEGFHFDGKLVSSKFIENTIENVDDWHVYASKQMNNLIFKDNNYIRSVEHDVLVFGSDYLFESESGIEKYDIRDGSGVIRNALSNSFIVSATNANVVVEFTDGRTFSVDSSGEYVTYEFFSGTHTIEVIGGASIGNISGTVTDAGTGLCIEEATVTVEGTGKSGETDANGDYAIAIVPTGTYTVKASKTGYQSQSKSAEVTANQTTTTDFQLATETTIPPTIITTHFPTETNVLTGTTITVTFSKAMNETSAENAFSISPPVTGSFTWDGNKMIFTPSSNLAYGTTYTVNISTEAEDLAGNDLESSYSWQLTTGTDSSIIYVTTDGSGDYNCDGINDHIEINQATAYINSIGGGTVHLKAGIYTIDGTVNIYSNTTFEGAGEGFTAIELDASNTNTNWCMFDVSNSNNVIIRYFSVDMNKDSPYVDNWTDCFEMYYSSYIDFLNITAYDFDSEFLQFYQASHCSVINCTAYHGGHDGVQNWYGDDMVITDNDFTDLGNVGVRLGNTKNSRVERNRCVCNDFGISLQSTNSGYPTENNLIKDNFIDNKMSSDEAIPLHAEGTGIIRNQIFIGNIIAHSGTYLEPEGFRIYTSGSGRIEDIYIINNVIRDCRGEGGIYAQDVDRVKNIVAKNNIMVDSTYGIYGKVISSYNNFWNNANGNYGGGASAGTGDISVDPMFADPANYDFHLKSTAGRWDGSTWVIDSEDSPCIDAGDPSSGYGNEPTPNGGRINIGAYGNTAEASKSVGVVPDNSPVARAGSDQTVYANTPVTLDGSTSTDDHGITSYAWDFNASDGLQPDATGAIVSHTYTEPSSYIVMLTVTDTSGNTDTDTCIVTVNAASNRAPILNPIGDKSIDEGSLLEFTIPASDPDGDSLTYSADNLPTGATFDPATRTFSWTPDYGWEGTYPNVHFEVTDGYLTDAEDITITVNNATTVHIRLEAEDAAEINPLMEIASDPSAYNGSYIWVPDGGGWKGPGYARYIITITTPGDYKICGRVQAPTSANNSYLVRMDDDPERTWTIPVTEPWAWDEVNHWGSGTETDPEIDLVIITLSAGEHVLTIKHRESGTKLDRLLITNDLTFVPHVTDTTPPVADAGQDQTVDNGTVIYFDGSGSTDDLGIQSYSWDFDASDGIQQDSTGVTVSHIYTEPGSYIVTLTVTDTSGNTATDTCMVTVNAPNNRPPTFTSIPDQSAIHTATTTFQITASDPDTNLLTFSAQNLPPGAHFTASNQTFTWTPTYENVTWYTDVKFTVSDGDLTDTETIPIFPRWDVDRNGVVNGGDRSLIEAHFGQPESACSACDVNLDDEINIIDYSLAGQHIDSHWENPPIAYEPTGVRISPESQNVAIGGSFLVTVSVTPGTSIAGMQFNLGFDATLLSVNSVIEGDLLSQNESRSTSFVSGTIDNTAGTITNVFGCILGPYNATAPGTFAIINMTAKDSFGTSDLDLTGVVISDPYGHAADTEVADGTVTVDEPFTPAILNLRNDTPTSYSVNLIWGCSAPAPGIDHYTIYQDGALLTITGNAYYSVTGLTPATTYTFNVSATTTAGITGENATLTVRTAEDYQPLNTTTMGLWHFDEVYGTTVIDSSGNNNDGMIYGASWTEGKLDSALRFDGINDYVRIPNSPGLNPVDEITIGAWVKTGALPQAGWNKIVAKPYTSYTSPWQQYALTLHDNQFVFELNTGGSKSGVICTETLDPDTWYHVAGTYNGRDGNICQW